MNNRVCVTERGHKVIRSSERSNLVGQLIDTPPQRDTYLCCYPGHGNGTSSLNHVQRLPRSEASPSSPLATRSSTHRRLAPRNAVFPNDSATHSASGSRGPAATLPSIDRTKASDWVIPRATAGNEPKGATLVAHGQ